MVEGQVDFVFGVVFEVDVELDLNVVKSVVEVVFDVDEVEGRKDHDTLGVFLIEVDIDGLLSEVDLQHCLFEDLLDDFVVVPLVLFVQGVLQLLEQLLGAQENVFFEELNEVDFLEDFHFFLNLYFLQRLVDQVLLALELCL